MSKIGLLKPVGQGNREELHGEITTLQMQLKIKLIPNNVKTSDTAPDYIVCAAGYSGQDVQIGAAWKKRKDQIGDVSFEFLSITIDDPSLPSALNVAAFKNDQGEWEITFRRRQAGQAAA
jgi:uncharacterized protein (DUF736 family)